jgi:putative two-component system response regulator
MHDIGKVATPDAILLKPGKFTDDEFAIMKEHSQHGYDILSGSDSLLLRTAASLALTHHEKFDGTGYPNQLKAEAIPLYSRIVSIADVFDALTSIRPYKKAWLLDDALNFLKENAGTHFDPECVEAFLRAWKDVLSIHEKYQDTEF